MSISKTLYMKGLQCPKALWLKKNGDVVPESASKTEALFATGYTVGDAAQNLFPGGSDMLGENFNARRMLETTTKALAKGESLLYEAAFSHQGLFVALDILKKTDTGWDIYEVKSSTRVKGHHIDDMAVQYYVVSQFIPINNIYLMHVNKDYERSGSLDLEQLFTAEDQTDKVMAKQSEVRVNLENFKKIIASDQPNIDIGPHCQSPYNCEYKPNCWGHVQSPSVFNLYRMSMSNKFNLYQKGYISLMSLPEDERLNKKQQVQIDTLKTGVPAIDKQAIKEFLNTITFPVSFFDFETFQNAIPRYDQQMPYEQIPFQYSLHILHHSQTLEHQEFLGSEHCDPRRDLCERMLEDLPAKGSIVAYNQSFEISRIKGLAKLYPDLKESLMALIPRFVDLIVPFRNGAYYHPDFNGSFSIKSVLPALFPNDDELDYKKLTISHGGMAMDTFANLPNLKDLSQRDKVRHDLLAYCRLDTLAMVRIYEKLKLTSS
jgi:hypothetical protein